MTRVLALLIILAAIALVVGIVVGNTADAGAQVEPVGPVPQTYAATRGCTHEHPSRVAYRATTKILKSSAPLTRSRFRRVHHYVVCVATVAKKEAVARHVRRLVKWRSSYVGYWKIQRGRLSSGIRWTLARLRGCETRGYGAAGYRLDGHHDGAYQYTVSTWGRAQWWVPARYRTAKAFQASAAHQDVVTARFFPSHRSEWACKV